MQGARAEGRRSHGGAVGAAGPAGQRRYGGMCTGGQKEQRPGKGKGAAGD